MERAPLAARQARERVPESVEADAGDLRLQQGGAPIRLLRAEHRGRLDDDVHEGDQSPLVSTEATRGPLVTFVCVE